MAKDKKDTWRYNKMKKMVTLAVMMMMVFSFSLTAQAAKSPQGTVVEKQETEEVKPVVSPKTGESEIVLYGLGAAAVVLASGAVIVRRKEMAA